MHATLAILAAKRRSIANKLRPLPIELAVSLPVLAVMVSAFLVGSYRFFFVLFRFLRDSPPFGTMLTERLLAMLFLTFLSMLAFSNVVTSLSTLYLSSELEFLLSRPVPYASAFFAKFWESVLYSSSAFVIMGLPVFAAYGRVHEAPPLFYLLVFCFYVPFLVVPAAIGTLMTMLLALFLPARKTRAAFCALFVLLFIAMVSVARAVARGALARFDPTATLSQLVDALEVSHLPYLPNHWITQGIVAAARADLHTAIFYLLALASTAAMGLQVLSWLSPTLYYPGWARTRESDARRARRPVLAVFGAIEWILRPVPRPVRALFIKDLKAFWRDPAQWAQMLLLFGLLITYITNVRNMPLNTNEPFWQSVISFFNLGATCFVMATLTSRFVFPMWSLEGQQFWVVGLAPLTRRRLMVQKLVGCALGVALLGETIMMYSNYMLRVPGVMVAVSGVTVACASVGLVSLAIGLGAVFPSFHEDNAARIANGAGGTLNVVVSLLYVAVIVAVQAYPIHALLTGKVPSWEALRGDLALAGAVFLATNLLAIGVPLWLGLRAVDRMEL